MTEAETREKCGHKPRTPRTDGHHQKLEEAGRSFPRGGDVKDILP